MANNQTKFTGRGGKKFTIGEGGYAYQDGQRVGEAQWKEQPGGIYTRVDPKGSSQGVWIDPRTRKATDAPMEGYYTGRGGGKFFTDPQGFRLTGTGGVWTGKHGTQRIVSAQGDSPYQQVLYGDQSLYVDDQGVLRSGMIPGTGGAGPGQPIPGDIARGGAPGYPSIEGGVGMPPSGIGDQGIIGPATGWAVEGSQPYTPQPTASAVLSDPIQSRLEDLAGPRDQFATQTGMTQEQDINWQMNRILQADNPMISNAMEQARQNAYEEANARGLLNTSMAVAAAEQAAQEAAYNIALPMAQQAVAAEQQVSLANLQSRAQFQQSSMQIQSQEAQQRAQLAAGEIIQNLVNNNQITLKEIDRITQLQGIQLSEENKRYLTQITEDNKLALQTNASVATAYSNTVSAIGQVYSNPDMSPEQQNAAAAWYMDQFEGYVQFQDIVGETNYSDQMNWGGAGVNTQINTIEDQIRSLEDQIVRLRDMQYTNPYTGFTPGFQPGVDYG